MRSEPAVHLRSGPAYCPTRAIAIPVGPNPAPSFYGSAVATRSLHLGFVEQFGMSPMAYLKVLRLNRVRRRLRDAPAGVSVTDLAMRSGFRHLGRFATGYRRFFGEAPSATLRHLSQ